MNYIEFYYNRDKYKGEDSSDFLSHYGILGQKWGQRRWQNADGTFNEAGKERYFSKKSEKRNAKGELLAHPDDPYDELTVDRLNEIKKYYANQNPSENQKIGGYTADHFHKNIYLKTDKNTLKKIKKYPDIYDTEGLTDDEILKAIRRVPKIPNARAYGREIREELYNAQLNKTRSKYYETNTKDIPEAENIEDQKIGSNPDKKVIKEGKKLEKELVKSMDKSWEEREKLQDKIINDPKYKEVFDNLTKSNNEKLAKEYSRLNEIFDDYEKNETENVAKGGIASWMLDGNTKMGDLGRGAWLYLFEDLNQGYANAESLYTRYEKNIDKKEINDLYTKLYENKDLHKENIQYLKDNNKALSQVNDAQLLMLVRKNEKNNPNNKTNAYWDLYNAADDSVQNGNKERDAYKEAKKVAQKLNKSCGNDDNGWNWLNKAIENLGMDDIDYKNMTQADWDKLNAEVNRLKK